MSVIDSMFLEGGPLSEVLHEWEPRQQQVDMSSAVAEAMESRGQLLVEAGTGVGKSFGYLVPAIRRIIDHHETVVIATNTITLQEQIIHHDVPILSEAFDGGFEAVLVKGRANYISLRRMERAIAQRSTFQNPKALAELNIIKDWSRATVDGSRASLPMLPRGDVWELAKSDGSRCLGKKCPTSTGVMRLPSPILLH